MMTMEKSNGANFTTEELKTMKEMSKNYNRHTTVRWLAAIALAGGLLWYHLSKKGQTPIEKHQPNSKPEKPGKEKKEEK